MTAESLVLPVSLSYAFRSDRYGHQYKRNRASDAVTFNLPVLAWKTNNDLVSSHSSAMSCLHYGKSLLIPVNARPTHTVVKAKHHQDDWHQSSSSNTLPTPSIMMIPHRVGPVEGI